MRRRKKKRMFMGGPPQFHFNKYPFLQDAVRIYKKVLHNRLSFVKEIYDGGEERALPIFSVSTFIRESDNAEQDRVLG